MIETIVNLQFEVRLASLVSLLHNITRVLESSHVPYELIGGMAVIVYCEEANSETTPLTRGIDVMIHRAELRQALQATEQQGISGINFVFSGEKTNPKQLLPNPPIRPGNKEVEGEQIKIITVEDLITMKLSANRIKDQRHIQVFDEVGLIDPAFEERLSEPLAQRLRYIRAQD